jgi:hypothetical protein
VLPNWSFEAFLLRDILHGRCRKNYSSVEKFREKLLLMTRQQYHLWKTWSNQNSFGRNVIGRYNVNQTWSVEPWNQVKLQLPPCHDHFQVMTFHLMDLNGFDLARKQDCCSRHMPREGKMGIPWIQFDALEPEVRWYFLDFLSTCPTLTVLSPNTRGLQVPCSCNRRDF